MCLGARKRLGAAVPSLARFVRRVAWPVSRHRSHRFSRQSHRANRSADVCYEAAEEFGVFGNVAHVSLKESNALFERGKLLKELFLSERLFRETAPVFIVSVDKTHDDIPFLDPVSEEREDCSSAAAASHLQSHGHSTTKDGLRATGRDRLKKFGEVAMTASWTSANWSFVPLPLMWTV